jgi:hypothetical protein
MIRCIPLHGRLAETGAWLSAVLTSANLISIFVLQKLAAVLADKEQMKASQGALLRQVRPQDRRFPLPHLAGIEWHAQRCGDYAVGRMLILSLADSIK